MFCAERGRPSLPSTELEQENKVGDRALRTHGNCVAFELPSFFFSQAQGLTFVIGARAGVCSGYLFRLPG